VLTQLTIKHFALVDHLSLELEPGATMITGETGAGKSIIIGAIQLALGQRGNTNMIQQGKPKAEVSLLFDVDKMPNVQQWLRENDLAEDNNCLIRRIITQEGKSRCYINGTLSTLQTVKTLAQQVLFIHGQHANYHLFQAAQQLALLDAYANNQALLADISKCASLWQAAHAEYQTLKQALLERTQRSEFLQFQIEELNTLNLSNEAIIALPQEHQQLARREDNQRYLHEALDTLSGDDNQGNLSLLAQQSQLRQLLQKTYPKGNHALFNLLDQIDIAYDETQQAIEDALAQMDMDPATFEHLDQTLSTLHHIARKHHIDIADIPAHFETLEQELDTLQTADDQLIALEQQMAVQQAQYDNLSKKLTIQRHSAAKKLCKQITQTIQTLSMPKAIFTIDFDTRDTNVPHLFGQETVNFTIQTNPGSSAQPLAKIASGGELSRVSLAIQVALAKQQQLTTIFDEVDVGISGGTAELVGKLLRKLGESQQVLTITHQPQVAACAHHHWCANKVTEKNRTHSSIKILNKTESTDEIARMLGGVKITPQTKALAEEMMATI